MPPRLLPDEPLPPYTYVPGRAPHPVNDPQGHLFGQEHDAPSPLDPSHPEQCLPHLRAVDLFNTGYYWEAHEEWEGLWHAAGRTGTTADFLKGLIKLAAAGVKAYEGRAEGVRRHANRAAELLKAATKETPRAAHFAGLNVKDILTRAESVASHPESLLHKASQPPLPGLVATLSFDPS